MREYIEIWKDYRDFHEEFWRLAKTAKTLDEMERHLKHASACVEMLNYYEAKVRESWK